MKVGILLFLIFGIWIGLGVLSPATVQAELITIGIEAVVDYVQDSDNYLKGRVNLGDLITGSYTYDTDTPDSSPLASVGRYEHFDCASGFSLSVGGLNLKTDFSRGAPEYFTMWITNGSSGADGISVKSYNNLPLRDGTSVNNIVWYLRDTSQNAISSIELPTTAPVLNDWRSNFLDICGGPGDRVGFCFSARVFYAVVIPEPASILLLGLGGLAFTRRRKK